MKKIVLFLMVLVCSCIIVNGQSPNWSWAKGFGGTDKDGAGDVIVDSSGNVFTVGFFHGMVDFDPGAGVFNMTALTNDGSFFLTKMNASGDFLWAKQWIKGFYNYPYTLDIDQNQNVYVTGPFSGSIDFDPGTGSTVLNSIAPIGYFILKLDNNGNFVWAKVFGGVNNSPQCYSTIDTAGNIYCGGFFTDSYDFDPGPAVYSMTAGSSRDLFVLKLDPAGNFVWAIKTTGTIYTWVNGIGTDPSGNIFVTGSFSGTTDFDPGPGTTNLISGVAFSSEDIYILKLTPAGALDWVVQLGMFGSGYERPATIDIDASGNIYSTGKIDGLVDFDPGPGTYYISTATSYIWKIDNSGNFIFAKGLNTNGGTIYPGSLGVDGYSNIYFSGTFNGTTDFDPGAGVYSLTPDSMGNGLFIAALDSAGDFIWAHGTGGHTHVGNQNNSTPSVYVDAVNNIYVCGAFEDPRISFGTDSLFNASQGTYDIVDAFVVKIEGTTTGLYELSDLNQSGLIAYPNPSSGIITLHSTAPLSSLDIYNTTGQLISKQLISFQTEFIFDLTKFNKGMYFFVAHDQFGMIYSEKVTVE